MIRSGLILAAAAVTFSAAMAAGRIETTPVWAMKPSSAAPADWSCSVPGAVTVGFEPGGGQFGKGMLYFQVNKPAGIVEVKSPLLKLPVRDGSVSSRRIKVEMIVKARDFNDGAVQVRFRQQNGRWANACNPHRDWDTITDINRMYQWKDWTTSTEYGVIGNSTASGQLCLLINTAAGKGRLEIDKLVISEDCEINHRVASASPDNMFNADQGRMTIDWYLPDQIVKGELLVRNEAGTVVRRLPVNSGTRRSELTLPQRGFYEIEAVADYRDGSSLTTARTAGVVGPRIDEAVRRQSRYGVMRVHAGTDWAVRTGVNLDWGFWTLDQIQRGPDGKMINKATAAKPAKKDLFVIAGMHGVMPKWLRSEKCQGWELMPPRDWTWFAEAVECWAKTCPDLPDIVAVYNEPDAHWRGSEDDFVRFHQEVTKAVKKGRPGTKVGGPCMYSIRMKDFRRYVEKGVLENMDCVVMHAYVNGTAPEAEFIERLVEMQDYLKTTKYARLPVYLTEFGWTSPPGDWQKTVDELTKARYCVRSQILCTARDIGGLVYFNGRYCQLSNQYSYSIVKPDYTPLPAMVAFSAFLREFSTVKGGGQWLKLSPDLHWTAFARDGQVLVALWTVDRKVMVDLPGVPVAARDMMGKTLVPAAKMEISPSPVYLVFPDKNLLNIPVLPVKKALPGDVIALPLTDLIVPPGLQAVSGGVKVTEKAMLGDYTVLGKRNGRLEAQALAVLRPLEGEYVDTAWRGDGDPAVLTFKVRSLIPGRVKAEVALSLDGGIKLRQEVELESGVWRKVDFVLKEVVPGRRYRGNAVLSVASPIKWQVALPCDTTMIAVPVFKAVPDASVWSRIPAIDFTAWQDRELNKFSGSDDCNGRMQAFAAPDGFHLRVVIGDDQHRLADLWGDMWKEDSVQVAFDVDTDQEWQPNNVGHGLNGHRVVEYTLGLHSGKRLAWCPMSYLEGIKTGPAFDLMKTLTVTRDEKSRQTVYDAVIPWRLLGLKDVPAVGTRLGFSMAVNDKDDNRPRRILRLFNGIANGKDPVQYGKLRLIEGK